MSRYVVFYDGQCGFCDAVVQFLLHRDKDEIFAFAPLQGATAKSKLKALPQRLKNLDTVILLDNSKGRLFIQGQAAFMALWLLGGVWSIPGGLAFIPPVLYNWAYRLVAANRHRFFSKTECVIPSGKDKERFLD